MVCGRPLSPSEWTLIGRIDAGGMTFVHDTAAAVYGLVVVLLSLPEAGQSDQQSTATRGVLPLAWALLSKDMSPLNQMAFRCGRSGV